MKRLLSFICLLFLLACNKNSNELKPIKPDPIEYDFKAMLCGDDYLRCLVQVGKSSSLDTSNIKVEVVNNLLLNKENSVEAYLWFQTGKTFYPDSVKFMQQLLDTSTQKNISSLFEIKNKGFVITKLDKSAKCNAFQYGHCYKSGNYKSINNKDTFSGDCRAIMAADGNFNIWLNDSKNKTQHITGKLIESTPSFCSDCKRISYGSSDTYTIELIKNAQMKEFDTTGVFLKFNLKSINSSGDVNDTLFIILNK